MNDPASAVRYQRLALENAQKLAAADPANVEDQRNPRDGLCIWRPAPISLGGESTLVFLNFYGTGFRSRSSLSAVHVTMGGVPTCAAVFCGSQGMGLDLLIAGLVPGVLSGKGQVDVLISVDAVLSNQPCWLFDSAIGGWPKAV
jgi:hypothetical protein